MAGLKYWVWLSEVKGLTNRSKLLLLDYFGTPENVYYADEDEYRLVEGIEPRQIALLAEKSLENADCILGACSRLGLRLLTMQARSSASIRPGRRPRRGIFPCETASSAA